MKSFTKQELAEKAGVSVNTLNRWCEPFREELAALGLRPRARFLPPVVVKFITEKLCIDL